MEVKDSKAAAAEEAGPEEETEEKLYWELWSNKTTTREHFMSLSSVSCARLIRFALLWSGSEIRSIFERNGGNNVNIFDDACPNRFRIS